MRIEGGLSVKAALLAGSRSVEKIMLDEARHDKDAAFIRRAAAENHVPVVTMPRAEIDALASGRTHGGVLAEAGSRRFQQLEECLQEEAPFLALVEGVEDPFNLGYIMRSLYSAGCSGLILDARDWGSAEATILKSSAGASEYIRIVMSRDAAADVRRCRERGLICYAAMRKDAVPYFEADFQKPFLIGIGGEMRGLSAAVLAEMTQNVYIPYANGFRNALNAAGAAAALGFEALRQRSASNRRTC
jgi:23S rRNA (guanosine2251-2'-O)-methyltransferase